MNYQTLDKSQQHAIANLFTSAFTDAADQQEGIMIGQLTSQLALNINDEEIIGFGAYENESLIGVIFFTRLTFSHPIDVYMLAPVAITTEYQRKGIGQSLIHFGLNELKKRSVSFVVTYGDPAFYSRVGFEPLSEAVIKAPLKLSMPFGWQGQSLSGVDIPMINERPTCTAAFNNPIYW